MMEGKIISFIIWSAFGIVFICLAIYSWFSRKPIGFWANVEIFDISDIKKYNHAMAKLFCIFGIVLIALGIPLLAGQNSAWILLSVVGVMLEGITAMAIYSLVIEKKYKKGK